MLKNSHDRQVPVEYKNEVYYFIEVTKVYFTCIEVVEKILNVKKYKPK